MIYSIIMDVIFQRLLSIFIYLNTLKSRRDLFMPVNGENKELLLHRSGFLKKLLFDSYTDQQV